MSEKYVFKRVKWGSDERITQDINATVPRGYELLTVDATREELCLIWQRRRGVQWQPIETAPLDGTDVLLWWPFWCKTRPVIGRFGYKGLQQWIAMEAMEGDGDPPEAWMPLPEPPK